MKVRNALADNPKVAPGSAEGFVLWVLTKQFMKFAAIRTTLPARICCKRTALRTFRISSGLGVESSFRNIRNNNLRQQNSKSRTNCKSVLLLIFQSWKANRELLGVHKIVCWRNGWLIWDLRYSLTESYQVVLQASLQTDSLTKLFPNCSATMWFSAKAHEILHYE